MHTGLLPVHPKGLHTPDSSDSDGWVAETRDYDFRPDEEAAMQLSLFVSLDAHDADKRSRFLHAYGEEVIRLEPAHVVASTRELGVYDLFLVREGWKKRELTDRLEVDGVGNVFLLDRWLHEQFVDRELFFWPYPTIGWKAPGQPRPMDEMMEEPAPVREDTSGFRLPPAEHVELCWRSQRAGPIARNSRFPCIPLPATAGIDERLAGRIKVPAAAFMYSSVTRLGQEMVSTELEKRLKDLVGRKFYSEDVW